MCRVDSAFGNRKGTARGVTTRPIHAAVGAHEQSHRPGGSGDERWTSNAQ